MYKLKSLVIAIVVFFVSSSNILARQEQASSDVSVVPPSPNAASLLKYANIPVDLYTGVPKIDVDLHTLKGRHLQVPITVSYHSSGIKVEEIASWAGLGWTLNAGGAITRIMKGLPDDDVDGYVGTNLRGQKVDDPLTPTYLYHIAESNWDAEPDIFYFNFLGRTGRFVFNNDGEIVILGDELLAIEPALGPLSNQAYWIIRDEKGVEYKFGVNSSETESTTFAPHGFGTSCDNIPDPKTFISTWYLSEVSYKGESVSFAYSSGADLNYSTLSDLHFELVVSEGGCNPADPLTCKVDYTAITIHSPKYISQITSTLGEVQFWKEPGREDINGGYRLDKIRIRNDYGNLMDYEFTHGYFFPALDLNCSSANELCKRLRLDRIIQKSPGGGEIIYRDFGYNTNQNLPRRDSKSFDHWGYYNGAPNNSLIPSVAGIYAGGANRLPSATSAKANMLNRIEYPTGGYVDLAYELNEYSDGVNNHSGGGHRIHQISEFENPASTPRTTTYSYQLISGTNSSGLLFKQPVYHLYVLNTTSNPDASACAFEGYYVYSHSLSERFDLNGNHIGYSEVTVANNDGGHEVSTFTNYNDFSDTYNASDYFKIDYNGNPAGSIDPLGPPFAPPSETFFWARGILKSKKVYDNQHKLLAEEDNTVISVYSPANLLEAKGIRVSLADYWIINSFPYVNILVGRNVYSNKGARITETNAYVYDQIASGNQNTRATYTLHPNYGKLVRSRTSYLSNGDQIKTEYRYPVDYTVPAGTLTNGAEGIKALKDNNMLTTVVEEVVWYKKAGGSFQVISGMLYKFDANTNLKEVRELEVTTPSTSFTYATISGGTFTHSPSYKVRHLYNSYDAYGNLTQETTKEGLTTTYEWAYNNSLVAAVNVNPGTNQHRTTYVHRPLVGVTTITDPNGLSTTYEYDEFSRLRLIRDYENNIIERYRYHYRTQSEGLASGIIVTGTFVPNSTLTFSSNDARTFYGDTKYYWNFGDGTTLETFAESVQHAYTSAGTKNVTLVLDNPEYESVNYATTVAIIHGTTFKPQICATASKFNAFCDDEPTPANCSAATAGPGRIVFALINSVEAANFCSGGLDLRWEYHELSEGNIDNDQYWHDFNAADDELDLSLEWPLDMLLPDGLYYVRCVAYGCQGTAVYKSQPVTYEFSSTGPCTPE